MPCRPSRARHEARATGILYILIVLLALNSPGHADSLNGTVIGIVDGNTLGILGDDGNKQRVRLAGIDAPELNQDHGAQAKRHLGKLVLNKEVLVEYNKWDQQGRIVGKLFHDDIGDVNLAMVKAGLAWWYRKYKHEQSTVDQLLYEDAQRTARREQRGLWTHPHPLPPWEWRTFKRDKADEEELKRQKAFERQRRQLAREREAIKRQRTKLEARRARQQAQWERPPRPSTSYHSSSDTRFSGRQSAGPRYVPSLGKLCREQGNGRYHCR